MRTLLVIIAACAVGVAFSLGFAGRADTTTANCAGLVVPMNSDHTLAYDPQTGQLQVGYYNPAGHLVNAAVNVNDATCRANPGVARAIEHALEAANAVHDGDCAQFRAALNGAPLPAKGGVKPDLAAAKQYVDQEC